jgi:predicted DNA-binding transcriptional regulator AlpA
VAGHLPLISIGIAPRLLKREQAAAYISVSPNLFDQLVKDGRMPRPKLLGGQRRAWDIRSLDAAIDQLPNGGGGGPIDKTWEDVDGA